MSFTYKRTYRGPIEAVILDWAGCTMDFGCMAPAVAFVEVYKRQNVPITMDEARAPMGAHKRVHIHKISQLDAVRRRWQEVRGRLPMEEDVDRMFADFVPLQLECLSDYSDLIPGTLDVVKELRSHGIKIGSTTGYLTEMMEINQKDAERQGYKPDSTVCAADGPADRPVPPLKERDKVTKSAKTHTPDEWKAAFEERKKLHGSGYAIVEEIHDPSKKTGIKTVGKKI